MKRAMCILMALLFLLGLSACGKQKAEPSQETPRLDSVDPETGAWLGQGGCYQMESLEMPEGAGDNILFYHDGQFYTQRIKDLRDTRIYRGGEEILRYEGIPLYVCKTEDGLWVEDEERDEERKAVILTRFSFTGEQLQQLRLELPPYIYPLGMKAEEGRIYLNCSASLRVYDDEEGSLLCDIPHEEWSGHPIRGGDGKVYFLDQGDRGGGSLSAIDTEAGSFDLRFVYEKGSLSTGDAESPFFLCCSDGIYRMELDGQIRPLVIWDECGLSTSGVSEVQTLGDGRFRLSGITGDRTLLVPAEPSELRARTTLTICVVPSQTALDTGIDDVSMYYTKIIRSITAFNACSRDCCVKFVDLSENGALTAEQAITKLNTRILSGEAPDMIVFQGGISPFSYIRQGLLRDFREDLAADPEIAEEDLILARAIENDCGGLYLMTDGLSMETRLGLQSRFGEAWGWSLDDYYRIDRETPEGRMVIYNLTRDYFLHMSVSRYLRQAIDWGAGTCDFDNADFVRILEACRDVHETPEDPNNMVFGSNLMAEGYLVTELCMVGTVTELAQQTRRIGLPVSVIGWPTPDGGCGTDFRTDYPIGVLKDGAHPELCWQFLRFCLLNADSGIPNFRPLLEQRLDEARQIDPDAERDLFYDGLRSPITETEIRQFRELLDQVEHTTLYDDTALAIVKEEMGPFLAGQRSAEETARIIQSRMSIYVSEQG